MAEGAFVVWQWMGLVCTRPNQKQCSACGAAEPTCSHRLGWFLPSLATNFSCLMHAACRRHQSRSLLCLRTRPYFLPSALFTTPFKCNVQPNRISYASIFLFPLAKSYVRKVRNMLCSSEHFVLWLSHTPMTYLVPMYCSIEISRFRVRVHFRVSVRVGSELTGYSSLFGSIF